MSDEFAGAMTALVLGLIILYFALILAVILVGVVAIFFIGWYMTRMLFQWLDTTSGGVFLEEHGGLLLLISGSVWAALAGVFIPNQWLWRLRDIWPQVTHYPYIIPIVGCLLGFAWGMLVLYKHEQEEEYDLLDAAGMHQFSNDEIMYPDADTEARLSNSLLLGYEDDSWIRF